jgi:hypothetical protein
MLTPRIDFTEPHFGGKPFLMNFHPHILDNFPPKKSGKNLGEPCAKQSLFLRHLKAM